MRVVSSRLSTFMLMAVAASTLPSCASVQSKPGSVPAPAATQTAQTAQKPAAKVVAVEEPQATLVEIPVVVTPKGRKLIPKGSRIVITDMSGECAAEVREAVMRRIVDNTDYSVLARDHLEQIMLESKVAWGGKFNTLTAVKLGELLGASLFIVGRVTYCGTPDSEVPEPDTDEESDEEEFTIQAVLQIIDLATGKVLLSSSTEGTYVPGVTPLLLEKEPAVDAKLVDDNPPSSTANVADQSKDGKTNGKEEGDKNFAKQYWAATKKKLLKKAQAPPTAGGGSPLGLASLLPGVGPLAMMSSLGGAGSPPPGVPLASFGGGAASAPGAAPGSDASADPKKEEDNKHREFPKVKAADDLANQFADKFFARPIWESVEMWKDPRWHYGDSVRYVKLGHCPRAVTLLESVAKQELSSMPEPDVARFMHNYGVALLCANNSDHAMRKLRSAYRISYHNSTLKMLALSGRIVEWDLDVEVDIEPEMKALADRPVRRERPAAPLPSSTAESTSPKG